MVRQSSAVKEIDCEKTMTRTINDIPRVILKACRFDTYDKTDIDTPDSVLSSEVDESMTEIYADNNMNIEYLPTNIHEKFPNLLSMSIWFCKLRSVSNTTFKNLKSLIRLAMNVNFLESFDDGTFADLVNLKYLYIDYNRLHTLDGNIFKPLTSLRALILYGNICINENFGAKDFPDAFEEITTICTDNMNLEICSNQLRYIKIETEFLAKTTKNKLESCEKFKLISS